MPKKAKESQIPAQDNLVVRNQIRNANLYAMRTVTMGPVGLAAGAHSHTMRRKERIPFRRPFRRGKYSPKNDHRWAVRDIIYLISLSYLIYISE